MSEHHQESFWTKYVFSQDHKWIGIQYGVKALFFMLFGFALMIVMRYQMVHAGTISPDTYNSFGAMHGTIMVFLGVVPVIVGAYGNYLVPLQIGAPDMAFPKLNMASYWCYFLGGVTMLTGFALPGGAANSGWTSYPPLANIATTGQTDWLLGMLYLIASS